MKQLTILFESPNVFKVLPEWPERLPGEHESSYKVACEQSKANAIRIENSDLLPTLVRYSKNGYRFKLSETSEYLNSGDIFQVEGFEYKVNNCACNDPDWVVGCEYPFCKKAILKLAKEEEPKHNKPLREHFEIDTDAGICLQTFRYIDALEKYIEEIEKLKK